MRKGLIGLVGAAVVAMTGSASAANNDGTYLGSVAPVAGISAASCKTIARFEVKVAKGVLTGASPFGEGAFTGTVKPDGFISGQVAVGKANQKVEGRISYGLLSAALFTGTGANACAYVITMDRK